MTPPLPPTPDLADIVAGGLILLRVSTMTMFLPVLGHQLVPPQVKIGLMALIAMLMYPVARPLTPAIPPSPVALAVLAGQEIILGGMLAMLAQLVFAAVQLAGQLMSYQMGISIANIMDPVSQSQVSLVGQLAVILAMLVWMAAGGHHAFLAAIADSFRVLPIGHPWSGAGWQALNDAAAAMFSLGLRLAAPVLLLLLFTYVALGLLSRAVPQIQIFFVSFPLTIGLGLFAFALALPAFLHLAHEGFRGAGRFVPEFLRLLNGA